MSVFPLINNPSIVNYIKDKDLVSRHGVLLAWKFLLANNSNYHSSYSDKNIGEIFKLILKIHEDHMIEEINDNASFITSNSYFNYYDNYVNQFARAYYIFVKNVYINSSIDFANIKSEFYKKYNMSIEEYIYMMFMIVVYVSNHSKYIKKKGYYFTDGWGINPFTLPGISEDIIHQLIKLLDQLSFDYIEGNSWSKENLEGHGEFFLFVNKPLIKINNNCYIPLERKIFEDLLFNSLFHKINACYENEDKKLKDSKNKDNKFIRSFGLMFQEYVEWITSEVCKLSQEYYKIIPEFFYGKDAKRSPDVMILHEDENVGDTVLVIEVKSSRAPYDVNNYFNVEFKTIDSSKKRLISGPILQSIKAISDIVDRKCNSKITGDKVYYFLSVTMSNLPFPIFDDNIIINEIKEHYSSLKIGGFNSISIEEFEVFLQVLIFPNAKPFGWYLEKFRTYKLSDLSFKNFIKDFPRAVQIEGVNSIYDDPITLLSKEAQEKAFQYFLRPEDN